MTFADFSLPGFLKKALDLAGLTRPTTIQERSFPIIMSGRDMTGVAQTGTGKTLAYLLPLLSRWKYTGEKDPSILILVPTRELVMQVKEQLDALTERVTLKAVPVYGGTNIKTQSAQLLEGADVVIATPGRLLDLIYNRSLKTRRIKMLVIDEVDEMFTLGFRDQLTKVLDLLPAKRQNLMFSATLTEDVDAISHEFFVSPVIVEAAPSGTPLENIKQYAYRLPNFNTRINLLKHLFDGEAFSRVMIFCAGKRVANALFDRLYQTYGEETAVLHANKDQNYRFRAVEDFRSGAVKYLVATDLVARGLDVSGVSHVINFDLPLQPEQYIHRIGRTGRAEEKGTAISLITEQEEEQKLAIEVLMGQELPEKPVPEEVEISQVLIPEEMPEDLTAGATLRVKREPSGPAFHEKKAKNKKVNIRYNHKKEMQKKYGKPRTKNKKR